MAYRLGEYVIYGEINNKDHYSTCGGIILRGERPGEEVQLHLELTGDCCRDLRGKHIRFEPGKDDAGDAVFRKEDSRAFQISQIGPTGLMTAQGWARVLPCSVEEFMRRSKLGEPPPTPWKRRLYLEWYGQNGRVVVEMADPVVEVCVRERKGEDDEGEWEPLPNLALPPACLEPGAVTGPEITVIRLDGDEVHTETWTAAEPGLIEEDEGPSSAALQRHLDAEADAVDRAMRGETEPSDDGNEGVREAELIDYCMDHCEEQPISSLLDGAVNLRPPDELDDKEVEAELKSLLARMALLSIALDVCKHFSPRDCYRLLRDEILPEPHAYAELVGTGWVTHIPTYEYCKQCEAEFDDEYEAGKISGTE
ncbi:MAG: hypothetical protein NTZ09_18915 [Candidatus Hydrogenedentes bacterium]|nr:hypothetical protein [Candidatus Hydrogenedentota bacterium]